MHCDDIYRLPSYGDQPVVVVDWEAADRRVGAYSISKGGSSSPLSPTTPILAPTEPQDEEFQEEEPRYLEFDSEGLETALDDLDDKLEPEEIA